MLDIVLEYWKLSKFCFIIGKSFGLLGLYTKVKGIISSFLTAFGYLKERINIYRQHIRHPQYQQLAAEVTFTYLWRQKVSYVSFFQDYSRK